jgi:plasmid stabilization system protein ParE
MAKLTWAPTAIGDIKSIAAFIGRDSIKAASNQVQRFFEKASILEKHPSIGKPTPEIGDDRYREIHCGRYRIIYKISSADDVYILTIHHQSRLLDSNPVMKSRLKKRR